MNNTRVAWRVFGHIDRDKPEEQILRPMSDLFSRGLIHFAERGQVMEPIILINSRGGSTEEAVGSYSYLRQLPMPITTIALGEVHSAATYVFLAGERRWSCPTATFLFHEGGITINAPKRELRTQVKIAEAKLEAERQIIMTRLNLSRRTVLAWLRYGKAFDAKEALKIGLVTKILERTYEDELDDNPLDEVVTPNGLRLVLPGE